MIPQRWTMILTGAFLFCALFVQAQQQLEFRELIVQVPGIASTRGLPEIKNKLSQIPGVFIVAFCETQHLIMMKLDKKKHADNRTVYDAITGTGYKFYVKEGATISKAKSECKDKKVATFHDGDFPME